MNSKAYKVIFNKTIGRYDVVSELVTSGGKAKSDSQKRTASSFLTVINKISLSVLLLLGAVMVLPAVATTIIVDRGAPKNQQPIVVNTAGAPVVNIQTPTSSGVSMNQYKQFDISNQGAVLNNSRKPSRTQLSGVVSGNPFLTHSAKVIVNQVNSTNPSYLNGFVEVAGQKANVVIANPAGISVNGGGFINADKATLTTGLPLMTNGDLDSYRVVGGMVTTDGQGLNASEVDYLHIITQATKLNAPIQARKTTVTLGLNQVKAQDASVSETIQSAVAATSAPTFSFDATALGGMYANKIHIVSTQAGVGVNNAGQLVSQNMQLDVNGKLTNSGTIQQTSATDKLVIASQGLANSGDIAAVGEQNIDARQKVRNSGHIVAQQQLNLTTSETLDNSMGHITAAHLDLTAKTLNNDKGNIEQTGVQQLDLIATKIISGKDAVIGTVVADINTTNTAADNNNSSATSPSTQPDSLATNSAGATNLAVTPAPAKSYTTGSIKIAEELVNGSGKIVANGKVKLTSQGGINNDGTINVANLHVKQHFTNSGKVFADKATIIDTNTFSQQGGSLEAQQDLTIRAQNLVNSQKSSLKSLANADISVTNKLSNIDSEITAHKFSQFTSDELNNHNAQISASDVTSNVLINITKQLTNADSKIYTAGGLTIKANSLINSTSAGKADESSIAANGQLSITTAQNLNNNSSKLLSNDHLTLNAQHITNQAGSITSQKEIQLNATNLDNSQVGKLTAGTHLNVQLTGELNNNQQGTIAAQQADINTKNINNAHGQIVADQANIATQDFTNTHGLVSAQEQLILEASGNINNNQGQIEAKNIAQLKATNLDNSAGEIIATNYAKLTIDQTLSNQGEKASITVGGNLDLSAVQLNNTNQAKILVNETANINAQQVNNHQGSLQAKKLNLNQINSLTNHHGTILADNITADISHTLDNNQGNIQANNNITLGTTPVDGSQLIVSNQDGGIQAVNNLNIQAKNIAQEGEYSANNSVHLSQQDNLLLNNQAKYQTNNLKLSSLGDIDNYQYFGQRGNLELNANNIINHQNAKLEAEKHVSLIAKTDIANAGTINSGHITDAQSGLTLLKAGNTITNQGGGKIYGNYIALEATNLHNQESGVDSVNADDKKSGVIAARYRLDIGAKNITNIGSGFNVIEKGVLKEQSSTLLTSQGTLHIGAKLDDKHNATGQADTLLNKGAKIESAGDMYLTVEKTENKNSYFEILNYADKTALGIKKILVKPANDSNWYEHGVDGEWVSEMKDGFFLFYKDRENKILPDIIYSEPKYPWFFTSATEQKKQESILQYRKNLALYKAQKNFYAGGYRPQDGGVFYRKIINNIYLVKNKLNNSQASLIEAGRNLIVSGKELLNDKSQIIIGGTLQTNIKVTNGSTEDKKLLQLKAKELYEGIFAVNSIQNEGSRHNRRNRRRDRGEKALTGGDAEKQLESIDISHTYKVVEHVTDINIADKTEKVVKQQSDNLTIKTLNPSPTNLMQHQGLFEIAPADSKVLIVTDKDFIAGVSIGNTINPVNTPLGAWYQIYDGVSAMLAKDDPNNMHKRLGDAYFEQQQINDQIMQLTGHRRVDGYSNDVEQFKQLIAKGQQFAQKINIAPGVALSAEQMAWLTDDIIRYELTTVTDAAGNTQQAWVPKVYLVAKNTDVNAVGGLISAQAINLKGNLNNSGTVVARELVNINSQTIVNDGKVVGKAILAHAKEGLINNGKFSAEDAIVATAGRDIKGSSTVSTTGDKNNGSTAITNQAGFYVNNANSAAGTLIIEAGRNMQLNNVDIDNQAAGGQTSLAAKENINFGTVTTESHTSYGAREDRDHYIEHRQTDIGSKIKAVGNVAINAGNKVHGTQLELSSAQGAVNIYGTNGVDLQEGRDKHEIDSAVYNKSKGFLSKKTTQNNYYYNADTSKKSSITGATVAIVSDKGDVNLRSTDAISDNGTYLQGKNITLSAGHDTYDIRQEKIVKKSGLLSFNPFNGGFSIGKEQTRTNSNTVSHINSGATVHSLNGSVVINAENEYKQTGGSTVGAGTYQQLQEFIQAGLTDDNKYVNNHNNITINAKKATIEDGIDATTEEYRRLYQKTALTLEAGSPLVDAALAVVDSAKKVGKSDDDRVNAAATYNAGVKAYQAVQTTRQATQAAQDATSGTIVKASISIGHQQQKYKAKTFNTQAQDSSVVGLGNVNVNIRGAGKDSNLNMSGGTIVGANSTNIDVQGNLNQNAAEQIYTNRTNNQSVGGKIGLAVEFSKGGVAFGINVGVNGGKGYANADGVTYKSANLGGFGKGKSTSLHTDIKVGENWNINGGSVYGNSIDYQAKNLNITSLQDKFKSESKQWDASVEATFGYGFNANGSFSQTISNSDYASVTDMSGIFAGDAGVRGKVNNLTSLDGSIITSTAKAEQAGLNKIQTGIIKTRNIENYANYSASGFSLGGGVSVGGGESAQEVGGHKLISQGNNTTVKDDNGKVTSTTGNTDVSSSQGFAKTKGNDSNTTYAGIGTHNIVITDEQGQQQLTDQTAKQAATDAYLNINTTAVNQGVNQGIANNFDQDKVMAAINHDVGVFKELSANAAYVAGQINQEITQIDSNIDQLKQAGTEASKVEIAQLEQSKKNLTFFNKFNSSFTQAMGAPNNAGLAGSAVLAASPWVNEQIKAQFPNETKPRENALAHAVFGAIRGAATQTGVLSNALSAAAGEIAAAKITQHLYGTTDSAKLSAEQKQTVSSIISLGTTLASSAAGSSMETVAANATTAKDAVENNIFGVLDENGKFDGKQNTAFANIERNCGSNAECLYNNFVKNARQASKYAPKEIALNELPGNKDYPEGSIVLGGQGTGLSYIVATKADGTKYAHLLPDDIQAKIATAQKIDNINYIEGRFWTSPIVDFITSAYAAVKGKTWLGQQNLSTVDRVLAGVNSALTVTSAGIYFRSEANSLVKTTNSISPVPGAAWDTTKTKNLLLSDKVDIYYANKTATSLLNNIDREHFLRGHLNKRGSAVGGHMEQEIKLLQQTAPPDANGVYKGKIAIKNPETGRYVVKKAESTFFPRAWSEARIKYELAEALKQQPTQTSSNPTKFIGVTPSGIKVQFVPLKTKKETIWRGWPLMEN